MLQAIRGPARRHLAHDDSEPDHALGTDPSLTVDAGLSAHRYLLGRAAPLRAGESSLLSTHLAGASPDGHRDRLRARLGSGHQAPAAARRRAGAPGDAP